jgi:hypothetical protein
MRKALVLVLGSVLVLGACGGEEEDGAADSSAASTTAPLLEEIVIRTRIVIAAEEGAEPIATGKVLGASTVGRSPFCVGGTIRDSHGSPDPAVFLIARTITCPDGQVRMDLTPNAWTIVTGTGAFEGLNGSGEMEVVYGPDEDSPAHETLTGTFTR